MLVAVPIHYGKVGIIKYKLKEKFGNYTDIDPQAEAKVTLIIVSLRNCVNIFYLAFLNVKQLL